MISFATLSGLSMLVNLISLAAAQSQQAFQFTTDDASVNDQWTTFPQRIERVAVIGAGPSGLQAATHLLAANLSIRLFERAPAPGGQWFYTEETPVREQYPETDARDTKIPPDILPATRYYEEGDGGISLDERWREHWHPRPVWYDLIANSPADKTRLPGVNYAPDAAWEVSVHDVQRNVRAYASLHRLNSNDNPISSHAPQITSYATRVESLHKGNETDTWTLKLHRLEWLPESKRLKAEWWTEEFDAVVVASGAFTEAKVPQIKGIGNWSKVKKDKKYSIYHAQSYRHPEPYTGKTVLIVGASVTATYLARSIAPFAGRLLCSVRPNQYRDALGWDILFRFPEKAEMIPEIESFQPLDDFTAGIKAGKINLVNGSAITEIDEIILATGYNTETFLPDLVKPRLPNSVYWTGHYMDDRPTLAYTLFNEPWRQGEYAGLGFARVWTGKARLPSRERMWVNMKSGKYNFGKAVDFLRQEGLCRMYVSWLNSEALEFGGQLVAPQLLERREIWNYWINTQHKKDFISHENWTRFEQLPFDEWPQPRYPSAKLVSW
ncbi:dimethylaniline monooxygenase [Favolaschia claudopus]|uniref:Dimethylaniline monooxygenase n=1 Tax=Favolaschia claudopus TaxID=2862362 RepID=A0AAW0CWL1_9AGAR